MKLEPCITTGDASRRLDVQCSHCQNNTRRATKTDNHYRPHGVGRSHGPTQAERIHIERPDLCGCPEHSKQRQLHRSYAVA